MHLPDLLKDFFYKLTPTLIEDATITFQFRSAHLALTHLMPMRVLVSVNVTLCADVEISLNFYKTFLFVG